MRLARFISYLFLLLFLNVKAFAFTDPNHVDDFDFSASETISTTVKFNPDGKTMFVIGVSSDTLRQYSLGTAFDLSSSPTLEQSKIITLVQSAPQDIEFNSDGTILYIIGTVGDDIDQWTLSSPYDIGSVSETESSKNINIGGDPRGLKFSNDGKKLFIVHQITGAIGRVDEYTLTTPYDLDTITQTNELTLSYSGIGGRRQGINFSSDGYKLFITNSATDSSDPEKSKNLIREYSLQSPFNISNPTNNGDFQPSYAEKFRLTGLTFNNDGSKMFHTDFSNHKVYEYTLSCGFGVKTCTDPTNDKDDVASIESQSEASKKLIQHTTYPVLNRMEWLRRNSGRTNLTNQNIKFQISNEILSALSESLIPIYFSNENSEELNLKNKNWSFWSEGTINIGKIGDTLSASSKSINTTAITIGADKRDENNIMRGFAIRMGADDVNIGNLGSAIDMSAMSLTFYESKPKGSNKFVDSLVGITLLESDLVNNSGTISTKGKRNGAQLFGSVNFRDTYSKDNINFTPKFKISAGATHYTSYSETGADGLNLNFKGQNIANLIATTGTSLDNTYELSNGTFIPYFDIEYYADISPSSSQKFSYASDGSVYSLKYNNNSVHNFRSGVGFDFATEYGLNLMSKYTRDQSQNGMQNDSFIVALDYRISQRSSYAMSIQDTSAKLSHNSELNGLYFDLDSKYDFFSEKPQYGIYLKVSNRP